MDKLDYPWGEVEWTRRTKAIADFINKASANRKQKVLDLGGGLGHLNKYIKNCDYLSMDLQEWTPATIVADFNKGEFPDITKQDILVVQGTLEYINDPVAFLKSIQKYGPLLILTYRRWTPDREVMPRNRLSFDEVEKALADSGWTKEREMGFFDRSEVVEKIMLLNQLP